MNTREVMIITGSTRGIGLSLVKFLINKYCLVIHGKSSYNIELAKKELGESDNLLYCCMDLENNPTDLIDETIKYFGKIDILINNAGVADKNDAGCTNINVNAIAPYILSKYAVNKGVKRIINISSGAALCYEDEWLDYCLSKNLLESITKNLAVQFRRSCIVTGCRIDYTIKTDMTKQIDSVFENVESLFPLFLFLLREGSQISGRIYSAKRAKTKLFLEKQFNNNFVIFQQNNFQDYDDTKYVCNGDNWYSELGYYPTTNMVMQLETKIADTINCSSENITIVSGGITGCFEYLCSHFITCPGDELICHTLTFAPLLCSAFTRGAVLRTVQPKLDGDYNMNYYLENIIDKITPATKMIYLVHPTYIFCDEFETTKFENFLKKIPTNIPLILDECYLEYNDRHENSSVKYMNSHFIVGLRSFSKAYGLASCRLGYIVANKSYKKILSDGLPLKSVPTNSIKCALNTLNTNDLQKIKMNFLKEKIFVATELKKLNIRFKGKSPLIVIFLPNVKIDTIVDKLKNCNIIIPPKDIVYNESILYQIGIRKYNKIFINILKQHYLI